MGIGCQHVAEPDPLEPLAGLGLLLARGQVQDLEGQLDVVEHRAPGEQAVLLEDAGDPTRLSIVGYLARKEGEPVNCSGFLDLASKTSLSYHLAKLREAGVTRTEVRGTSRLISLRRADLDERFPGLLDSIIPSAMKLPWVFKERAEAE